MDWKRVIGSLFMIMLLSIFAVACSGDNEASSDSGDDTNNTEENSSDSSSSGDSGETADTSPIKIGVLASLSGPLEAYGTQTKRGFELGLEYATDGTMEVNGRKIEVVFEDTETDPKVARQKAIGLLEEDQVDFLVGSSSSGDTKAVLPLAEEYKKIMVVEPAVADSITGADWNKYIFRTARNSSQDAAAGAAAIAKEDVKIATLAPDYSFGRDGVAAFKQAATDLGADIVHEEYADPSATDFTANIQKVIEADPDYLFVIWAGANTPWNQINDMKLQEKGIKISTGAPDIAALKTMKPLVGMEGFTVYYHDTPKGKMTFREEDHQALQSLYKITLEEKEGYDYPVPVLERVLSPEETAPPVQN